MPTAEISVVVWNRRMIENTRLSRARSRALLPIEYTGLPPLLKRRICTVESLEKRENRQNMDDPKVWRPSRYLALLTVLAFHVTLIAVLVVSSETHRYLV